MTVKSRVLVRLWKSTHELLGCENTSENLLPQALLLRKQIWENFHIQLGLADLFLSVAAGRFPPVTMTGYGGWGKSSSRPGRRRTWRTIDTPLASTSRGWVFNRSRAPAEQHWAARIQKHISTFSLDAPLETRVVQGQLSNRFFFLILGGFQSFRTWWGTF